LAWTFADGLKIVFVVAIFVARLAVAATGREVEEDAEGSAAGDTGNLTSVAAFPTLNAP